MERKTVRAWLEGTAVFLLLIGFGLYFVFEERPRTVRYDCSISEISPDYPIEVKEACRKIRASYNKNEA